MRRVETFVVWVVAEGGFGRIVYGLLALCCGLATISEIVDSGLTDTAGITSLMTAGLLVAMFSHGDG